MAALASAAIRMVLLSEGRVQHYQHPLELELGDGAITVLTRGPRASSEAKGALKGSQGLPGGEGRGGKHRKLGRGS